MVRRQPRENIMGQYIKYAISIAIAGFLTDKIMKVLDKDENKSNR